MRIWQVATVLAVTVTFLGAAGKTKEFSWSPPKVARSMFSSNVGMLNSEREEYATTLASLAGNHVAASKASAGSLSEARRMIGLALQLSPRNKRAVVLNFQLSKSMLPEAVASNYSPEVFARLLLARAQLLQKQGGAENQLLARCFLQLSASLNPKNDDAVYASEVSRLDHGSVDWDAIVNPKKPSGESPFAEPSPANGD